MRFIVLMLIGTLVSCVPSQSLPEETAVMSSSTRTVHTSERIDFASKLDARFRFSAVLPFQDHTAFFVPSSESIAIFNPTVPHTPSEYRELQASIIFIRFFEADRFLTLSTVDILERQEIKIGSHDAVRYRIRKKAGVADFPNQPWWRNQEHELIDIRYAPNGRTFFYVFSYRPDLDPSMFQTFMESVVFHNDEVSFMPPLDRLKERAVIKPFGIKIDMQNSPVLPERFSGYHTGIDYEILNKEEEADVTVFAYCGGPVREKKNANGYGGVLVQECMQNGEVFTALYGHLRLSSIEKDVGAYLIPGEKIGVLGTGFSEETDGERKHLHFSLHQGRSMELRGYVQTEAELTEWMQPTSF